MQREDSLRSAQNSTEQLPRKLPEAAWAINRPVHWICVAGTSDAHGGSPARSSLGGSDLQMHECKIPFCLLARGQRGSSLPQCKSILGGSVNQIC